MGLLSPYLTNSRLARIRPYLRGHVLDIGCGYAEVYREYQQKIESYTGIEMREEHVAELKLEFPSAHFYTCQLDDENLPLDRSFDCIVMMALIEHIFNQKHLMQNVKNVLAPDGKIVITTPTPLGNDLIHKLGARVGLFAQAAADDHIVLYNHHRFGIMCQEVGLSLEYYQTFQLGCNQLAVLTK